MYKIIGADQKEYGPISGDQLRQWISEGRVNGETKVQPEGAPGWKRMAELPEFASVLPVAIPPPAVPPVGPTLAPGSILPPAPQPKSNQLAVWAMITGIISMVPCCWYVGFLPIILGFVALSQIKSHPGQTGSGFAITGVVLGIISLLLLLIGIVMAMAFPQYFSNLPNTLNQ